MSKSVKSKISIAVLESLSGLEVCIPFSNTEAIGIGIAPEQMGETFQKAIQKEYINKGAYFDALRLNSDFEIKSSVLNVPITPSKQETRYQRHKLSFEMLYWDLGENTMLGFIPVLGIETNGDSFEQLKQNAIDSIRLEFVRNKRFENLSRIVETQWFEKVSFVQCPVEYEFYSPGELKKLNTEKEYTILPEVSSEFSSSNKKIVGLSDELKELSGYLKGEFVQSVLVVGPNGCGKTALINEFARYNSSTKIRETTASQLIRGLTKDSGRWQIRLFDACKEITETKTRLFVGHISELFEIGQYVGNDISVAEALREPLLRGEIVILAEATEEELTKMDQRSPGFSSLFVNLKMPLKSKADLETIIIKSVEGIATNNQTVIAKEAVPECIRLTRRYSPYSGFPGKPIRFLESSILQNKKVPNPIDSSAIIKAFCEETGLPDFMINPDASLDMEKTRDFFKNRIFGQPFAIEVVLDLLVSVKAAMTQIGKPIASLLFVGPTGVGKTEMAKTLAEFIFANKNRMIRFDMSEYAEPYSILRLTGDTGGSGSSLVDKIRQEPFSVVLFDELEKAHFSFFDLLLQILGEGRLTDAKGQTANFCSSIIIMTSNLGASNFGKGIIGYQESSSDDQDKAEKHFKQAAREHFRPELFNRLDRIVAFSSLSIKHRRPIVEREIGIVQARSGLKNRFVDLKLDEGLIDVLCQEGHDDRYGARQMKRSIHQHIVIPFSRQLNRFPVSHELELQAIVESGNIQVKAEPSAKKTFEEKRLSTRWAELVEDTSDKRRLMQRIKEGTVFLNHLNQLDRLKSQKKRNKKKNQHYQATIDLKIQEMEAKVLDFEKLYEKILNLEIELALADYIEGKEEETIFNMFLEWNKNFGLWMKELYVYAFSKDKTCVLQIFGPESHLEALANLYTKISKASEYRIEEISIYIEPSGDYIYKSHSSSTTPYFRLADADEKTLVYGREFLTASEFESLKSRKRIGMALEITGLCSYIYFAKESAIVKWLKKDSKNADVYFIRAATLMLPPPHNVHRKQFFKDKKHTRKIEAGMITENTKYKSMGEAFQKIPLHPSDLKTMLDENLLQSITEKLCGDEEQ